MHRDERKERKVKYRMPELKIKVKVKDKVQLKVLKKQIVWESLMTCCKERVTPKVQKRGLQHA
jgi:lipoate synthase